MDPILPGIVHWRARHPKLGAEVSSYLLTDTGTAIDPLLPEGQGPDWIAGDVRRAILTVRHHVRSAPDLGVPVLAHRSGVDELREAGLDPQPYGAGNELAPGVRALPFGRICPDDAALHIALGPGALAFGDGLINEGGLGHPPDRFLGEDPEAVKADIVAGLAPLLDEDFDALLFAHGDPVAGGGKRLLREFVAARA